MGYSTDKMLPVESTPSGQSNLVSVEYTCIPHIWALEQSTMMALTLFASQSKQIIIKKLDLKDILGFYCGIKVVIQCEIVDFTLSKYIVIRIAIRPCLSQYIAIHFLVAIPIPIKYIFNVIYRQVSFLVVTQAFQVPVIGVTWVFDFQK